MTKPEKRKPKDFEKKLKECDKLKGEYLSGWKRARADFLNYKKEETQRISEFLKFGKEEFILKLLPILDSFERSSKAIKDKNNPTIQGFLKIKEQIEDFLKNEGVEKIETKDQKFDPNFHEAVEQVANSEESGVIIEELEKGYTLYETVIRPAKVRVVK